jgi:hypothetical protein
MKTTHPTRLILAALFAVPALGLASTAQGQILINEANAIGVGGEFVDIGGTSKPYEGYDYGVLTHSGNNNSPTAVVNPGNPFAADVDSGTTGNQTTLPNGWDGTTGWARIEGNGGDWLEFVVTQDNLDLRGWTLYWENDDDQNGTIGSNADERGHISFSQSAAWSNLRAGTIVTISEDASVSEIRDDYHNGSGFPMTGVDDTGFNYDLTTDLSFDPVGNGTPTAPGANADWHIHFHLDESFTDNGIATDYFEAFSDIKVDNDGWQAVFFNASNTTIAADANSAKLRSELDLSTGIVGELIGENTPTWGDNTGGGGVNNEELLAFLGDPTTDGTSLSADYEDVDFSTFGTENLYNLLTEDTLDGVQDFSDIRAWLDDILPGDANLDGTVDFLDFSALSASFGETGTGWAEGNFNGDGETNFQDFSILSSNFGNSSLALADFAAVPEPGSLALMGVAGLALFQRRRR